MFTPAQMQKQIATSAFFKTFINGINVNLNGTSSSCCGDMCFAGCGSECFDCDKALEAQLDIVKTYPYPIETFWKIAGLLDHFTYFHLDCDYSRALKVAQAFKMRFGTIALCGDLSYIYDKFITLLDVVDPKIGLMHQRALLRAMKAVGFKYAHEVDQAVLLKEYTKFGGLMKGCQSQSS